jgi:SAM-dependent methyltransferase
MTSAPHARLDSVTTSQRTHWERDQHARRSPDHPCVTALFEPRATFLASLVQDVSQASVLDVGSGNGYLSVPLQTRFGWAVSLDLSAAMLERSPARSRVRASAIALPFADSSFDVVVCSHLLHHLVPPERVRTIREMARVSRGAVVLYEPNRNNPAMFLFGLLTREERMTLAFSRKYLAGLLRESGLARCDTRVEGVIVPNKMPALVAPLAQYLDRTGTRVLGFYVRAVGWKR